MTDEELDDFIAYLGERDFEFEQEDVVENREPIRSRLRSQIARVRWDQIEESRVLAASDPQIQAALEMFDEAAALAKKAANLDLQDRDRDFDARPDEQEALATAEGEIETPRQ